MDAIEQFLPAPLRDVVRKAHVCKAPNVNEALEMYICASRHLEQADHKLKDYRVSMGEPLIAVWCHETRSVGPKLTPEQIDHKTQLCDLMSLAQSIHFKAYRELLVQLYGEEVVAFNEMLERRQERCG
jgi:hypothetical protein|uniref:Uncharacterized protein n=1 Tax=viral metagenome TaxID=1070528 RepID=A0A6C0AHL6_9ZZZZ